MILQKWSCKHNCSVLTHFRLNLFPRIPSSVQSDSKWVFKPFIHFLEDDFGCFGITFSCVITELCAVYCQRVEIIVGHTSSGHHKLVSIPQPPPFCFRVWIWIWNNPEFSVSLWVPRLDSVWFSRLHTLIGVSLAVFRSGRCLWWSCFRTDNCWHLHDANSVYLSVACSSRRF